MCFYYELYSIIDIDLNIRLTASIKKNSVGYDLHGVMYHEYVGVTPTQCIGVTPPLSVCYTGSTMNV